MARITLIDVLDDGNADDCENLGQASIAAVLRRAGYRVDLVCLSVSEARAGIDPGAYDIIGYSIYPNTADAVQDLARAAKLADPGVWICVGGQLATAAARQILDDCAAIDACLLGEAEETMLTLARAHAERGAIDALPAVATRTGPPKQIARAASGSDVWPVRDLYELSRQRGNPTARMNTSRGCVANCEFCAVNGFSNAASRAGTSLPRWRGRDAEDIYAEIRALVEVHGVRSFVFNDASFEDAGQTGRRRVQRLCELITESGVPLAFRCSMRAENVCRHGDVLFPAMRRAGFSNVFVGVESGSNDDLRSFAKIATVSENRRALQIAAAHDIDVTIGFIMFQPESTAAALRASCRLLAASGADKTAHYISVVDVYFGTPMHHRLARDGRLTADFSYKNPFGYAFADCDVAALSAGLAPLRDHPRLRRIDGQLYHLGYTLSALRALFGDSARPVVDRYATIRGAVAEELAGFFTPVFDELQPPGGTATAAFLQRMSALGADLGRLGGRVRVSPNFAPFFGGVAIRASPQSVSA